MESRVRAEKPSVPDTVTASTETNPTPAIPTHRSGPDVSPRGLEPLGRFVRLLGLIGKGPQAKPSVDSSPLMAFAVEGAQPRSNAAGAGLPLPFEEALVWGVPLEARWEAAVRRLGLTPGGFMVGGGGARA